PSLEVSATVSVTLVRAFQFASTALTVTLKATPNIWLVGVPVLPVAEPGAAVSPGTKSCRSANAPALTFKLELTMPATAPLVAVMVVVSALVNVVVNALVDTPPPKPTAVVNVGTPAGP